MMHGEGGYNIMLKKKEILENAYPVGSIVELICMEGESAMPQGLKGRVTFVDDAGQIHVNWDNHSSLALLDGVDEFKLIKRA